VDVHTYVYIHVWKKIPTREIESRRQPSGPPLPNLARAPVLGKILKSQRTTKCAQQSGYRSSQRTTKCWPLEKAKRPSLLTSLLLSLLSALPNVLSRVAIDRVSALPNADRRKKLLSFSTSLLTPLLSALTKCVSALTKCAQQSGYRANFLRNFIWDRFLQLTEWPIEIRKSLLSCLLMYSGLSSDTLSEKFSLARDGMGWLRLVGSIKLWVSFAKEHYKRDDILQKRPILLSILLTVATP